MVASGSVTTTPSLAQALVALAQRRLHAPALADVAHEAVIAPVRQ
jgi:hypothetical protein